MKKTNYVANDVAMRWLNRSVVTIKTTIQLLYILASNPCDAWESY